MERGFQVPSQGKKQAFLLEKGLSAQQTREAFAQAQEARKAGDQTLVVRMNKNRKFQKEQLSAQGYTEFREFFK